MYFHFGDSYGRIRIGSFRISWFNGFYCSNGFESFGSLSVEIKRDGAWDEILYLN